MAMLQKERWIFDSKRGLPRDTRNPQQSDQALRSFLEGTPDNTPQLEEQEFAVTKKKTRRKIGKKSTTPAANIVVEVDDDALSDAEVVVPEKKPKRARAAKVSMNSGNVFDDDSHFDLVTSENLDKKQKATNKPPPLPKPPTVKTQAPEYNAEDFNKSFDAKLERMFATIANNQANLAKSFTMALEEQRKEFIEMQRAPLRVPAPPTTPAFNLSQSGEVNLSLSPSY